jgi:periplasmic binding family protein
VVRAGLTAVPTPVCVVSAEAAAAAPRSAPRTGPGHIRAGWPADRAATPTQADTGLGVRAAATALGFVPVTWEDFDIVLSGDTLPAAEPLIAVLRTPAVQSSIDALGDYDLSLAGPVEMLA